jgi:hypothetical protein
MSYRAGLYTAMLRSAALALVAGSCASSTDAGTPGVDLRGTWSYTATQNASPVNVTGSLIIEERNGARFSGHIAVRETDASGVEAARAGAVSGATLQANSVDFDAFFENTARRHVGRLTADTMTGGWVRIVSASETTSGTFRAVRTGGR